MSGHSIELEHIIKSYSGKPVIRDVCLALPANTTTAIVGESGSGKSTLLQLINGLVLPDSGSVRVQSSIINPRNLSFVGYTGHLCNTEDLSDCPVILLSLNTSQSELLDYSRLPGIRRTMGYAVQGAGLFPHLTIRENVTLVARLEGWPPGRIRDRYDNLLALFGLDDELSGRFPHSLSGGQAQRVGLCRAMMLDPPLLLLDEPFLGLDPITRASIYREMLQLEHTGARSILLVTHDMSEAARLAERLVILKQGQVIQQGTLQEIRTGPADDYVRELFLNGVLDDA